MAIRRHLRFYSFLLLFAHTFISLSAQSIDFQNECGLQVMIDSARQRQQTIFIDCYTTWCSPCKWMDKQVFTNGQVAAFYNEHFRCFKLNMETPEGRKVAERFGVSVYPTFLFLSPDGELLHKTTGAKTPDVLLAEGVKVQNGTNTLSVLQHRFVSDSSTRHHAAFLRELAEAQLNAYEDPYEATVLLANSLSVDEIALPENWQVLSRAVKRIYHPAFPIIVAAEQAFFRDGIQESYTEFVDMVLNHHTFFEVVESGNELLLEQMKELATQLLPDKAEAFAARLEMFFYQHDPEKGPPTLACYLDFFCANPTELSHYAWDLYQHSKDAKQLQKALEWARKSVGMTREYYNTETLAQLLFASGQFEEAEAFAIESIRLCQQKKLECKQTQALLQAIRSRSGK